MRSRVPEQERFRPLKRSLRVLSIVLVAVTCSGAKKPVQPPAPVNYAVPSAAAPGAVTEVTFHGESFGAPMAIWTSFPAETASVAEAEAGTVRYRLKVPADVPMGIGSVRICTSNGAASLQRFMVDDLPSVERQRGSIPASKPQVIDTLSAVDGTCDPLAADYFRFTAAKGQRVAIEVVAQRLGSRMDPVLRLLDAAGRELAFCDDAEGIGSDARLAWSSPAAGDYLIELRDANYEGGVEYRYRLRVGDFPLVNCAFPLSGKHGSNTKFTFCGPDGERLEPVTVMLPPDVAATPICAKFPEGQSSGFVSVLCSEAQDVMETGEHSGPRSATMLPMPTSFSGRFEKPGVKHYFRLAAKRGQKLAIHGQTRGLGSPCDLVLQLTKADGTRVAESKPVGADDGALDVTIPADGDYLVSAAELNHRTGVYRLQIQPVIPGFTLSVETDKVDAAAGGSFRLKVKCVRRDYDGVITLSLGGDLAPFELTGQTIAAGKTEADLEVKVPVDVPTASLLNFTVIGTAKIGESEFSNTANTQPALKRIFPRLLYPPAELDGLIGLAIKK